MPRPTKAPTPEIFVANESGAVDVKGEVFILHRGITRVRAGHPLLKAAPGLFDPVQDNVTFDVEQATSAPGEKRGE